jgi:hypothetical protein
MALQKGGFRTRDVSALRLEGELLRQLLLRLHPLVHLQHAQRCLVSLYLEKRSTNFTKTGSGYLKTRKTPKENSRTTAGSVTKWTSVPPEVPSRFSTQGNGQGGRGTGISAWNGMICVSGDIEPSSFASRKLASVILSSRW